MRATCLSISYITCDLNDNFKIIEELSGTINSKFKKSRPFETDAMMAHNIPIKDILNQKLSNGELVDEWEKAFKKLSDKGTIFCGYNSFNYDNILLNNSLFKEGNPSLAASFFSVSTIELPSPEESAKDYETSVNLTEVDEDL